MFLIMVALFAALVGMVVGATVVVWRRKEHLLRTYNVIASYLSGMNRRKINWVAAQNFLMNQRETDAVLVAFKALLFHPGVFQSNELRKDENESLRAWTRAEQLGLSVQVFSGNPWAQWLKGMFMGLVEHDIEAAKYLFQLAANQGLALAQNSLGVVYQGYDQLVEAEGWYELAAERGVADAQYNLAMMQDPEFELMRPRLEQAAAQGHAEAAFYLAHGFERQGLDALRLYHEELVQGIIMAHANQGFPHENEHGLVQILDVNRRPPNPRAEYLLPARENDHDIARHLQNDHRRGNERSASDIQAERRLISADCRGYIKDTSGRPACAAQYYYRTDSTLVRSRRVFKRRLSKAMTFWNRL